MSFATLNTTWSDKSDLKMSNYDPYPNLEPDKAWWLTTNQSQENYGNDYRNPCNNYAQNIPRNNTPLDQRNALIPREAYIPGINKNYTSLEGTWGKQQPYTTN